MEASGVVPVHPSQCGEFDVFDGAPWPSVGSSDQFGLVEPVDRLGEGVDYESPTDPIEGRAPSSARRSP